jgi:hypothetical protein
MIFEQIIFRFMQFVAVAGMVIGLKQPDLVLFAGSTFLLAIGGVLDEVASTLLFDSNGQ